MNCPFCHSDHTKVVDKRDNCHRAITRRRRQCLKCAKRFTTYERIETVSLYVIKRNGKVEEFDRDKLKRGILTAVKKRRIPEAVIDELVSDIEIKLMNGKSTYVKSTNIGNMVLNRLLKIDKIGYLLFASVYKDFNSLADFESALVNLKS
jgi:transcriptional repressor NrdR